MGSVMEFNKYAVQGKAAAELYCKNWAKELEVKGKELSEQLKAKKIDVKVYNIKRSVLNADTRDLNSCIEKVNKIK